MSFTRNCDALPFRAFSHRWYVCDQATGSPRVSVCEGERPCGEHHLLSENMVATRRLPSVGSPVPGVWLRILRRPRAHAASRYRPLVRLAGAIMPLAQLLRGCRVVFLEAGSRQQARTPALSQCLSLAKLFAVISYNKSGATSLDTADVFATFSQAFVARQGRTTTFRSSTGFTRRTLFQATSGRHPAEGSKPVICRADDISTTTCLLSGRFPHA